MPTRKVPLLYVKKGAFVTPDGRGGWEPLAGDPVPIARKLYEPGESLYLFDLDAQVSGSANLDFYQALEKRRVFPWLDVGARKPEDVMDAFFAGAEAITIQLRHMPPELLEEVGEMAEADFYLGLSFEPAGLEKALKARDVVELVERVGATGVVLYETEGAKIHDAENVAVELQRGGIPTTWVVRPASPHMDAAGRSERFAAVVRPEAPR